ncbi:hypothetical protein G6F62_015893 [Rhizopus arrhizus]|nr:hypothetical protein G6F62_015893 [Rhizopus arrhizus]
MEADWRESPGPTLPWPSMEINQTTAVVGAQTAPARAPPGGSGRGSSPRPGRYTNCSSGPAPQGLAQTPCPDANRSK